MMVAVNEPRQKPQNVGSQVLSDADNDHWFQFLGPRNVSLAAGLVQVLAADPSNEKQWCHVCTGVISLVKDNERRSYFMRLYDLDDGQVWEQELYENMKFTPFFTQPNLMAFEGEDKMYGLNFSNAQEASTFRNMTENKAAVKERRNRPRSSISVMRDARAVGGPEQTQKPPNYAQQGSVATFLPSCKMALANTMGKTKQNWNKTVERCKNLNKKPKLKKMDIGEPTAFEHVQSITWGGNNMVNVSKPEYAQDAAIGQFIKGLNLKNDEEKKLVYEAIDKGGGAQVFKKELEHRKSVGCPAMATAARPVDGPPAPPPPVGGPPPPPPPPMGGPPMPPPPPSAGVPVTPKSDDPKPAANVDDGRSNFLLEIQRGTTLKKVDTETAKPEPKESNSVADAIAMALAKRREDLAGSSDDEIADADSDDESDWDDD